MGLNDPEGWRRVSRSRAVSDAKQTDGIRSRTWGQINFPSLLSTDQYLTFCYLFICCFPCNKTPMPVRKSNGLLFEKWKKMSQISVRLIMRTRWREAAFMWGGSAGFTVPLIPFLLHHADTHRDSKTWRKTPRLKRKETGRKEGRGSGGQHLSPVTLFILLRQNKVKKNFYCTDLFLQNM